MIQLEHLGKTYRSASGEVEALRDINLTIRDGEIFGVIGLSGAGKSTLVRCINLLERPTEGKVIIDGRDITTLPQKELLALRRNIGMIFQGFHLLEQRTVLGNVSFPLEISGTPRAKALDRCRELLQLVGLSDKENVYPSQLSGGQKQRVAIARALATNPRYLLCDEATSALDPNTTRAILELLKQINQDLGVTIVIITHEMKVIDRICDRVAVIDHSQIAEEGRVADVFADPRSQIARELILPQERKALETTGGRRLRLIFGGADSRQPIISRLSLECQAPVNILFADTREYEGTVFGHMIVELPNEERDAERIIAWLNTNNVQWEEEKANV
jgi:D-methionine transport system ATP-binding protein